MSEWITWKRDKYGEAGIVNGLRLFSINWSVRRDEKWVLRTTLPGFKNGRELAKGNQDALKAKAEKALGAWLDRVSKGRPE